MTAADIFADPAFKEAVFKTASTLADIPQDGSSNGGSVPRGVSGCSFNTASTFMDVACLQSIAEMSADADQSDSNVFVPGAAIDDDRQLSAEERLRILRMRGSAIQE